MTFADIGSSPRSRGTVPGQHLKIAARRFIPALAGNGRACFPVTVGVAVHPRARGERAMSCDWPRMPFGSSPRSRGTGRKPERARTWSRFIPALAGNGFQNVAGICAWAVHPRARGERPVESTEARATCGSSPRSRGTVALFAGAGGGIRFIPALAGNGHACVRACRLSSVHPRARGERACHIRRRHFHCGSSPRSRGTVFARMMMRATTRFIPALAGNGRVMRR